MPTKKKDPVYAEPLKSPTGYWWHIHHLQLYEESQNIASRRRHILDYKPAKERPIRLKWMTPVKGPLPATGTVAQQKRLAMWQDRFDEIQVKLDEALKEEEKARKALEVARAARYKLANKQYHIKWKLDGAKQAVGRPELSKMQVLHKKEHPGCPWDGKTLFPGWENVG